MAFKHHYYDQQIKRYITQFMAVFAGMKVSSGKNETNDGTKLISVPIAYGSKDRVVAALMGKGTQNKLLKLPAMSAWMASIDMAPEMRKGVAQKRRTTTMPREGVFPEDIQVEHQLMPVPYKVTMELSIYVSNQEQHMEILEQIMMIFDPAIDIQVSDAANDWGMITKVELTGMSFNENYPQTVDRRTIQTTLTFEMPIHISAPSNIKKDFIKDIYVRIGAVSQGAVTSEDIIMELDEQGAEYELMASADDLGIYTS